MLRYLLSKLVPVPMHSTYVTDVASEDIERGAPYIGNHFRTDDHHDLVTIRWWQWRGRPFRQHGSHVCI